MATFSVTANELKYASGSSWSSGKARQGVYSGTRYEGAINLAGLSGLDFSNIAVSQIQMRVTFGPAGGDSTKYLTFYKATRNSISGSIASMRGDSIGSITVTEAYNRTVTLTFNASSNAGLFNTFRTTSHLETASSSFTCLEPEVHILAATAMIIFRHRPDHDADVRVPAKHRRNGRDQRGSRQRSKAQYYGLQFQLCTQSDVEIRLVHSDAEHCRR